MGVIHAKGLQGTVTFDGATVTITKKLVGQPAVTRSIHLGEVTATTYKPGTWLRHGYLQFLAAGSTNAPETRRGPAAGRPPQSDMNSLSIRRSQNTAAAELIAAVENTRRLTR